MTLTIEPVQAASVRIGDTLLWCDHLAPVVDIWLRYGDKRIKRKGRRIEVQVHGGRPKLHYYDDETVSVIRGSAVFKEQTDAER